MDLLNNRIFNAKLQDSITINNHEVTIGDKISEGGYAIVYQATDTKTGEVMALK
jgi:serine/threonine protein kinase